MSKKQWVAVISDEDGSYCVLGPYHSEQVADLMGQTFVKFMDDESVGDKVASTLPIVSFEDARDEERRYNTEIAGEDVED